MMGASPVDPAHPRPAGTRTRAGDVLRGGRPGPGVSAAGAADRGRGARGVQPHVDPSPAVPPPVSRGDRTPGRRGAGRDCRRRRLAPHLFRSPGGGWSPVVFDTAARHGLVPIDWDVDPRDWVRPGTAAITGSYYGPSL